jgi:hypothetical protein
MARKTRKRLNYYTQEFLSYVAIRPVVRGRWEQTAAELFHQAAEDPDVTAGQRDARDVVVELLARELEQVYAATLPEGDSLWRVYVRHGFQSIQWPEVAYQIVWNWLPGAEVSHAQR